VAVPVVKSIAAQGIAGTEMERFQHKSGQSCGQTRYPVEKAFDVVTDQQVSAEISPL